MSQGLHASLSSYEFSRRVPVASSSSSDHSPTSLRSRSPQSSLQRPRLKPHGSYSYDARSREGYKIPLIEEAISRTGSDTSNELQGLHLRRTRSSEPPGQKVLVDTVAAISFPAKKNNESSQAVSQSGCQDQNSSINPERPSRPSRPSWTRTRSSGIRFLSQKNTSSQDNSSVRSVPSTVLKSDTGEPPIIRIEPLKPPPRPDRPQPVTTCHITVETPFSDVDKQLGVRTHNDSGTSLEIERRRSSIDARKLFSAPLQAFRKVIQVKMSKSSSTSSTPVQSETHLFPAPGQGHKSLLLRKDQTGITLQRVASLLEGHKPPKLLSRFGTCTNLKTVSTASSSDMNDWRLETAKAVSPTFNIFSKDSHGASTTSSILNMRMGSTPQNSPAELATYKVQRSANADAEEFLKIDISIRGGTSYLPSEARRIHTPPLPEDNDTGMRRGYFFDYNAPEREGSLRYNPPYSQLSSPTPEFTASGVVNEKPQIEQELEKALAARLTPHTRVTTGLGTSNLLRAPSCRTAITTSMHPTDFYDAKLANIDATPTDIDITTREHEQKKHHPCKDECQTNLAEIRGQQHETQLDYNIPEHFPNSPLCPRNPKYWRVIRNKGSQFRGCWMHGFRKYDVVPGVREIA